MSIKSELAFEFEHDGGTVVPGSVLYVHPDLHWRAGLRGAVERYYGDSVMLRADNGAVPVVPLAALSWRPHPDALAKDDMVRVGISSPTRRDVAVWRLAQQELKTKLCQ